MSFQSASKAHGISNREAKGFLFLLFILIIPFVLQYGYRALFYVPQSSALPVSYLMDSCEAKKEFQQYKTYPKTVVVPTNKKSAKLIAHRIIELNAADSVTLETLPGIGPAFASRILKYRKLLGGYVQVEQLKEVYGMPEETYDKIKSLCTVDVSKVNMISATILWENPYKIYHPYLSKEVKSELKKQKTAVYSALELKTLINTYDARFEKYVIF